VTFDLRDVTLVNQDAVTFLAHCEADGITLSGVLSMSETGSIKRTPKQAAAKQEQRYLTTSTDDRQGPDGDLNDSC